MKPFETPSVGGCLLLLLAAAHGCTGPIIRNQVVETMPEVESKATLIRDLAHPYGIDYVQVEGVSLVTGLDGTGADPPPSPQRAALMAEMQRRDIRSPSRILASPDTALVIVRGYLRPGMQKGDRFDVEVRAPSRSETMSLRGGWLLETRLSELAVLGQQIRSGQKLAMVEGPVLVDPMADPDNRALLTQGRVLSGGVAARSRSIGLSIDTEHHGVRTAQSIGGAINRRFFRHLADEKRGVATPKTDQFVDLLVHPRYKDNISRYVRVVRNLAVHETPSDRLERFELLGRQLADSVTAPVAALRLEAIGGNEAVEVLKEAIDAEDAEVRFYAAEALAYLDETDAVGPLAEAARDEPALRLHALAAISAMDDAVAHDALRDLLGVRSAETRYGAFRALTAMRSNDPLVRGENLGGQLSYHVLDTTGPPMIHVTRSRRAEIVLFGRDQALSVPFVADAGRRILLKGRPDGKVVVSRFAPGEEDQQRVVSNQVDECIRAIVGLGGTYPDVVQALSEAKTSGALTGRLKVDALPESGRTLRRPEVALPSSPSGLFRVAKPLPDLFRRRGERDAMGPEAG